jgi:nitrogen fixation protein NifB
MTYGRIHLPVAPRCNLGCNYCERRIGGMSYHSYRPAVCDRILTPEEALSEVAAHKASANLTVVGIAGPGEPLCNDSTFETLALVRERHPDLLLCLSTNGLLLPESAERLCDLGVRTLTVTLNTVDPEIGALIYAHVEHSGTVLKGIDGAGLLLESQLTGMARAIRLGLVVKVNSILIPGVNDDGHLARVARTARELGAHVQNITPLIPLGRFRNIQPPSCDELCSTRLSCERIIEQFRHCRQCRADAVGIPGREVPDSRPLAPRG